MHIDISLETDLSINSQCLALEDDDDICSCWLSSISVSRLLSFDKISSWENFCLLSCVVYLQYWIQFIASFSSRVVLWPVVLVKSKPIDSGLRRCTGTWKCWAWKVFIFDFHCHFSARKVSSRINFHQLPDSHKCKNFHFLMCPLAFFVQIQSFCLRAIWLCGDNSVWIYQSFYIENSCLLVLEIKLTIAERLNHMVNLRVPKRWAENGVKQSRRGRDHYS